MSTLKLFTTIFFAVFLAIITSHFFMLFLALTGMSSILEAFGPALSPLQTRAALPRPTISVPAMTPAPQPVQVDPEETRWRIEKQRAQENDIRLCKSWRKIYAEDPLDTYRMHMESACKRAYGGQ
ncbi:MAG: hypothetical protein ACK4XG_00050 [Chromatiaceae bacterium]|jgi:uncharacterized iron-regulated membrane protein